MPTDNISQTLKESYAQANSADVYLETLEVFSDLSGEAPYDGPYVGMTDLYTNPEDFESGDPLPNTGVITI